jgi:hypothetical protein
LAPGFQLEMVKIKILNKSLKSVTGTKPKLLIDETKETEQKNQIIIEDLCLQLKDIGQDCKR